MSKDLLERIISNYKEDYGSLFVKALERRGNDLIIYSTVELDEDPDLPKNIRLTCRSYQETNVEPRFYESLYYDRDHVLLWHYNQPHVLASFYGRVEEPFSVVGALYERHVESVKGWIPFSKYLNAIPLSELIRGGFGMLADGPEPLIVAYEEVMSRYGVSISHHQSSPPQNKKLSVLMFAESYVIAEGFSADAF